MILDIHLKDRGEKAALIFEDEAGEIWNQLNDMAENRPVEYQNFLQQQYREASEADEDKKNTHGGVAL